ncbi:MAG: hypothetical protein ACU837_12540 [Gammaproteobacteria bacterium]
MDDQVVLNGWGRPIIIQVPYDTANSKYLYDYARLVSAGPIPGRDIQMNGFSVTKNDTDADPRDDDRVLFLKIPDPKASGNIPCDQT